MLGASTGHTLLLLLMFFVTWLHHRYSNLLLLLGASCNCQDIITIALLLIWCGLVGYNVKIYNAQIHASRTEHRSWNVVANYQPSMIVGSPRTRVLAPIFVLSLH